ncbi:MAG: response regulator with CheY-like receiver domain and winged-helix DNA-binding domain [Bacteroidetes bacterium]|jgi:two-component system alkaline phosphatase synthesis response regulator PhoP|nr:response regulator with CheY-like receiver domain and winged-helix DNA-binding domain [Bacteroidota bacterium]MDF2452742.1 response regulator with CheY-like receiver domain and winged-helix DNA-binding domain [Bacteroidota bacterium]
MLFKILVIEDEKALLEALKLNLELEKYRVETCSSGGDALPKIKLFEPDLILLDIMLPVLNGIEIYKQLKEENITTPVIFLTAKNNAHDKIEGLKLGADDYITKPFDLEELLLRIHNVLKRNYPQKQEATIFKFDNCQINFSTFQVVNREGKTEDLSKREMALLKLLVDNLNNVVSRNEILDKLWTKDESPSSRTIDNYILNFRKLFEINQKEPIHFLSIRGVGYKFKV